MQKVQYFYRYINFRLKTFKVAVNKQAYLCRGTLLPLATVMQPLIRPKYQQNDGVINVLTPKKKMIKLIKKGTNAEISS